MKKMLAMILACVLTFSLSIPAFAADAAPATGTSDVCVSAAQGDTQIAPCAADRPTSLGSLPYSATVTNLCEGCGTYTLYYFRTTTGKLKIGGTLNSSGDKNDTSRYAEIELYEVNNDTAIDCYTIDQFAGSTNLNHTFQNLSSSKNYYLLIKNTTGWGGLWKDLWISGSVSISER